MAVNCKIHKDELAHWDCKHCMAGYCPECIVKREIRSFDHNSKTEYLCPKCMNSANWIAPLNTIEKFWKRIPKFFTYPLSFYPLVIIILSGGVTLFNLREGVFPLILNFIMVIITFKYSFNVLRETARGVLIPPDISKDNLTSDIGIMIKMIFLYIAIGFIIGVGFVFGGIFLGGALVVGAVLAFPAMLMVLVTTQSLFAALNLVALWEITSKIGRPYLLMFIFFIFVAGGPAGLIDFVHEYIPKGVFLFVSGAAQAYYTIITYNLMGYVLLQYCEEIGSDLSPEDLAGESNNPLNAGLSHVEIEEKNILKRAQLFSMEGNHQESLKIINNYYSQNQITTPELSEYFFKLLKMAKNKDLFLRYSGTHLNILVNSGEIKKACRVYEYCVSKDKHYIPNPEVMIKIGQGYYGENEPEKAVNAYNKIIKFFPDSKEVPKAYFRIAQVLNDNLNDIDKSKKVLNLLKRRYPDSEFTKKTASYLGC